MTQLYSLPTRNSGQVSNRSRFGKLAGSIALFVLILFTGIVNPVRAQFANTTVTMSAAPIVGSPFASLAAAITAVNGLTITGPVVVTCPTGTETVSVMGGYTITAQGTAVNTITIAGNGAANSILTAFPNPTAGLRNDAVIKIVGGDYITITGFTLRENPGNTTGGALAAQRMTEFGVGIFAATTTNGAQNNTIQNCTITLGLGGAYQNAIGIFSSTGSSQNNSAQVATTTAGTNSNNKIYSNAISGVAYGIYVICPAITATLFETGWDIGGTSASTANTITFGNATTSDIGYTSFSGALLAGIYFRNGAGNSVRFNSITSNSLSYAQSGGLGGVVYVNTTPTGVTYTSTVSDNTAISLSNTGTTAITGINFGYGIANGTIAASNNVITLNQTTAAAASAAIVGINAAFASATKTLSGNSITVNQNTSLGALTSPVTLIDVSGAGTTLNVQNNNPLTINQNLPTGTGSYGSGAITYVNISAAYSVAANITGNTFNPTGTIRSTGALNAINHTTGNSAFINVKTNTATINRISSGSTITFFNQTAAPSQLADTISSNTITFTGLTGGTTAVGISRSGGTSTNLTNINMNTISISGTNTGTSTGIIVDYGTSGTIRWNSITINTASPTINGITPLSNGIAPNVSRNTFSLTSSTTSPTAINGILSTSTGAFQFFENTFTALNFSGSFAGGPVVAGIQSSAGTGAAIFNNTITNLTAGSAGAASAVVHGILIGGATSVNVYRNKIYGLTANTTGNLTRVNGLSISGGSANFYNNLVGNLSAPAATSTDAMRGFSSTSTSASTNINVYYNTFLLSGSGGAGSGSSGIFHTTSSTATTAKLNLRNNVVVNNFTPNGAGLSVAFRRSSGAANALANYDGASNNNLFYAGTPSATNLIYSDGTSSAQTLALYKAGVFTAGTISPRDGASVSENPTFLSTTGSSSNFLHVAATPATQIESGAAAIASFIDDFDADGTRPAAGYPLGGQTNGGGSAPDLGADEGDFTPSDITGPAISYTAISNSGCLTGQTLVATISDGSGVNTTAGTKPRLYYKKSTEADDYVGNTNADNGWKYVEGSNVTTTFTFVMNYSLLDNPIAPGDVIQYFITAQDNNSPSANVSINSNTAAFAAAPSSVALTTAAFPLTGTPNSYTILDALSGTKTVGVSGDYPTLTVAGGLFAAINTNGLSGNLTVTILDASIAETGAVALNQINYACGGTYTLTIIPAAITNVVLSGSVGSAGLIDFNGADNVTFNGLNTGGSSLTISNTSTGSTAAAVRFINDASNNTLTNLTLEGSNGSAAGGGIVIFSTGTTTGNNSNTVSNSVIKEAGLNIPQVSIYSVGLSALIPNTGNTISGNTITNFRSSGIFISGATGATNFNQNWTIQNNEIYQTAARITAIKAISFSSLGTNAISGNYIHDMNTTVTGATAVIGIELVDARLTTVSSNRIIQTTVNGVASTTTFWNGIYYTGATGTAANVTLVNNQISIVPVTSTTQGLIGIRDFAYSGNTLNAYYNSVYIGGTGTGTTASWAFQRATGTPTTVVLRNNSFVNGRSNASANQFAIGTQTAATFTVSNNLYSGKGITAANFFDYGTASAGTAVAVAAWNTGSGDASSVNGIFGTTAGYIAITDLYTSATNLHAAGSSIANDLGVNVAGITTDFDGQTRSLTTPDIGCDEFAPSSIDMGATVLVSPTGNGCFGSTRTVTVTIRNYGSTTIDFSVNPVTVDVDVTGAVTTSLSQTVNSGTLAAATTQNVNMSATLDMTTPGTYTFNASTTVTGDGSSANDAITPVNRTVALPTGGAAGSITPTTASLSWTSTSSATVWDIYIGTTTGFVTPTGATPPTTGYNDITNPFVAGSGTPLANTTGYTWYVRADCGGGEVTSWVGPFTFTTTTPLAVTQASVAVVQASTANVAASELAKEILRIDLPVTGAAGTLTLTGLTVNSANIADADIATSGVKLYYTTTTTFSTVTAVGSGVSFSSGVATFSSLTRTLATGNNYIWVAYDIASTATIGNTVDASIPIAGITIAATGGATAISGSLPTAAQSPVGNRPIDYCTSTSSSGSSYFNSFSTTGGSTNITNSPSGYSATGYGNFTGQTVTQDQGSSINFNTALVGTTVGVKIWVDWNQDGDFVDSGEEVYWSGASYVSTASGVINVPALATIGTTRMRIRMDFNAQAPAICGSITRGETEDYTFVVTAAAAKAYSSSAVEQASTALVLAGSLNNPVIRLKVTVTGTGGTLNATEAIFDETGTATTADISNARLYWTGSSTTFATTTQLGSDLTPGTGMTFSFTQALATGDNYFWLSYDVNGSPTGGRTLDGIGVTGGITVGGTAYNPSTPNPTGDRIIQLPLCGAYTINNLAVTGGTNYNNFVDAFNALNAVGISCGVTFTVSDDQTFTELIPALTATGTSLNTITFQRSGLGTNRPIIRPASGISSLDACIQLEGSDYITFDGIDLRDNTSGTVFLQIEFGIYLDYTSASNGCQNNTFKNMNITMRTTGAPSQITSRGITSFSIATSAPGANSNNQFINLNISTTFWGISLQGSTNASFPDLNNTITNQGVGTSVITNFGETNNNGCHGVYLNNQIGLAITNTSITNGNGINDVRGIGMTTGGTSNTLTLTGCTISNLTASTVGGTCVGVLASSGATINVTNCNIHTLVGGVVTGLDLSTGNKSITGNTIGGSVARRLIGTGTTNGMVLNNGTTNLVDGNFIQYIVSSGITGFNDAGIIVNSGATGLTISNNVIEHVDFSGASAITSVNAANFAYGINSASSASVITGNLVQDLSFGDSGYGINVSGAGSTISQNRVRNIAMFGSPTQQRITRGIAYSGTGTGTISKNEITGIINTSSSGSASSAGIDCNSVSTVNASNNLVSNVRADASGSSSPPAVRGIAFGNSTTANVYNNTVYLTGTSSNAAFESGALYTTTSTTLNSINNIFSNNYGGLGLKSAIYFTSSDATFRTNLTATSTNNILYAGTPGVNNVILRVNTGGNKQAFTDYEPYVSALAPTKEDNSFTQATLPFVNVATAPYDLHIDTTNTTLLCALANRGITVGAVTSDIDAPGFTGSISGTTLTVTSAPTGLISIGQIIRGAGISANTRITAYLTGFGSTGTYTVNNSQTVGSGAITTNSVVTRTATPDIGADEFDVIVLGGTATLSSNNFCSTPAPVGGITIGLTGHSTGANVLYQWQVDGVDIVNGSPYSGATTTTLTINPVTFGLNGKVYRCKITRCSPTITAAAFSSDATLQINQSPSLSTTAQSECSPTDANITTEGVGFAWRDLNATLGGSTTYHSSQSNADNNIVMTLPDPAAISNVGTGTYYIKKTNGDGCSDTKSIDATVSNCPITWFGTLTNDWSTPGNWQRFGVTSATIPTTGDIVYIPGLGDLAGKPLPVISNVTPATAFDISMAAGSGLTIASTCSLRVKRNWIAKGSITVGGSGSVFFDGTVAQSIINDDNAIPGITTFPYLRLNNTAGLTIAANTGKQFITRGLELEKGVLTTNNKLELSSDASNTAYINDFQFGGSPGSLSGNVTIRRHVAGVIGYRYLSSPVVASPSIDVTAFGPSVRGINNLTFDPTTTYVSNNTFPTCWVYNENDANLTESPLAQWGWVSKTIAGAANKLEAGTGYAVIIQNSQTLSFTGSVYTNTVNPFPSTLTLTSSGTPASDGWHLLGNPFPSPISWTAFFNANSSRFISAVKRWKTGGNYSGQYSDYTAAGVGVNGAMPNIAIGQGFLVKVTNQGTYSFPNSCRIADPTTDFNDAGSYAQVNNLIRLKLAGGNGADEAVVYFDPYATDAFDDKFDALKMLSGTVGMPGIYTTTGDDMSINTQGAFTSNREIPVNMYVDVNGSYSLSVLELMNFEPTAMVYLEDRSRGTFTNLREVQALSYNLTKGYVNNRFFLHFSAPLSTQSTAEGCNQNDGKVTVLNPGASTWNISLQRNTGEVVGSVSAVSADYEFTGLAAGNYTVKFETESGYVAYQQVAVEAGVNLNTAFAASTQVASSGSEVEFTAELEVPNTTYVWNFGDGIAVNAGAVVQHTYDAPGIYTVSLSLTSGGCTSVTEKSISVLTATGIANTDGEKAFKLYPNPATDLISVQLSDASKFAPQWIEIQDAAGRTISREIAKDMIANGRKTLDVSNLANGVYQIVLGTTDARFVRSFVIAH